MEVRPQVLIIAGPNGAGKSTCAARFVPRLRFVNADNIARELKPGRGAAPTSRRGVFSWHNWMAGAETRQLRARNDLANRTLATRIPRWRDAGYHVSLFFIWIPSETGGGACGPAGAERRSRYFRSDHPAALPGWAASLL